MTEEAIEKMLILLNGRIPEKIETGKIADKGEKKLLETLNQLIAFIREVHEFIIPLSKGEFAEIKMSPKNFFGSPFKELHSRLRHLTWQAKQVAKGDYNQKVDFMGDFSEAFNAMIISLDNNETQLKRKIKELETALFHIENLEGILPICSNCKKIRIEDADPKNQNSWIQIERYLTERTEARFSHSICPACIKQLYPELYPGKR